MTHWVLGAARLLQFVSALVILGAALARLRLGLDLDLGHSTAQSPAQSTPRRWLLPSFAVLGILSALLWLSAEAATLTDDWSAVADVISGTTLGQVLALRAVIFTATLIVCVSLPPQPHQWFTLIAGTVVCASCAWSGHGSLGDGALGLLHQSADVLHLLAAGLWVGALVELALLARCSQPAQAPHSDVATLQLARGLSQFSALGPVVVAVLVLSGILNSWVLVGPTYAGLFSAYGAALLVKVILFGGMLLLAAVNRLKLTPRLQATLDADVNPAQALLALRWSLWIETALALLVLSAVALLGTLPPPTDI